jgi:WD40 repeat protein
MTDAPKADAPKIDAAKTHAVLEHKHARPLIACRFDPTGKFIFFAAEENAVQRLELATKNVTPLAAHDSWVRAIGFSPAGDVAFTGGYDGRLAWWPAAADKPEPIRVVDAHQGWLRALAVAPGGEKIATCGNDNLVKLWDAADGRLITELAGHASHVYNVAFHPTGETLVSCDLKGVVKEWDVSTASHKRDFAPAAALYKYDTSFRADIGGARSLAFNGDGSRLALGSITNVTNAFAGVGNAAIMLYDTAAGKPVLQFENKEKINGTMWGVAWHSEGFWIGLAGGGGGGWLYFFKEGAANEFFKLKLKTDGRDLAFSPDGTQVAVAHSDSTLRIYALYA